MNVKGSTYPYSVFLLACILLLGLCCSSPNYNQSLKKTYTALQAKNYTEALDALDKNKYLKKKYCHVLYLIEKGRLQMLAGAYQEAFTNLDEADNEVDSWKDLKDRDITGNIHQQSITETSFGQVRSEGFYKPLNELFKSQSAVTYRPTHYERILIHYYKALCMIKLNKSDEAEVEAKQLTLLSQNLDDLKNIEPFANRYVSDALPQLISGLIYEMQQDDNSAFIEYENAYKKLNDQAAPLVYGIAVPAQLRSDILQLSYRLAFDDRLSNYESDFSIKYKPDSIARYAIILIDNGIVPYKNEDYSWYNSHNGYISKGFDSKKNSVLFSKPQFTPAPKKYDTVLTISSRASCKPELIYNLHHVTTKTYNKRFEEEATHYIRTCFSADTVTKNYGGRHCDTRSWQTLPQNIEYVKLPLDTGWNKLLVKHKSGITDTIQIYAKRRNNFYYLAN